MASWSRDAHAEARLVCDGAEILVDLVVDAERCEGDVRLDRARLQTPEFPRLAALTIVELLESCYETRHLSATAPPAPDVTHAESPAPVPMPGADVLAEPDPRAPTPEPAIVLGVPPSSVAVRPSPAARWVFSASGGVLVAPRPGWVTPFGILELDWTPHRVLGATLSLSAGGLRHDIPEATLRHRFARLGLFGQVRLTSAPTRLSLGLGYVVAVDRFVTTPDDPAALVGRRRTVLQGGPALRLSLLGLRRRVGFPLSVDLGWMAPRARLRDAFGTQLLTWGGPYVALSVGIGTARP